MKKSNIDKILKKCYNRVYVKGEIMKIINKNTNNLMPSVTDEEAEAEIAEIKTQTQIDTDQALERILNGGTR